MSIYLKLLHLPPPAVTLIPTVENITEVLN